MAFKTLKNVDPVSAAEDYGVVAAIMGLLGGLVTILISGSVIATIFPNAYSWQITTIIPLTGLILGLLFGVIFVFVFALIYDFVAERVGGIKLDMDSKGKITTINKIDVISFSKIYAISSAIAGVVLGIIFGIFISPSNAVYEIALGLVGGLIGGFVLGLISAWIYNFLIVKVVGGIKIIFTQKPFAISGISPFQYAKINAFIEAIVGVVSLVLTIFVNYGGLGTGLEVLGIEIVLGLVLGYIFAILFNFVLKEFGGIKIVLGN